MPRNTCLISHFIISLPTHSFVLTRHSSFIPKTGYFPMLLLLDCDPPITTSYFVACDPDLCPPESLASVRRILIVAFIPVGISSASGNQGRSPLFPQGLHDPWTIRSTLSIPCSICLLHHFAFSTLGAMLPRCRQSSSRTMADLLNGPFVDVGCPVSDIDRISSDVDYRR